MKNLNLLIFLFIFGSASCLNAQNVNIPDANFKAELVANAAINTNADGEIQVSEAAAFTDTINVMLKNIADLTGIEAFTALTVLRCNDNQLTTLNVSANTALTTLFCNDNQLTTLDVSANTALTILYCQYNQLSSLNVSGATALTYLNCYYNPLPSLNINTNTALITLECNQNQLTSLNVSNNTALTSLGCSGNQLTTLDVSANIALTSLQCGGNQLTTLNVSNNTALDYLQCSANQLSALDVSANTALTALQCYENQLTTLDVSSNTALIYFYCNSNLLTALDVSPHTTLIYLSCHSNQLTTLNVKNGNNINVPNSNFNATNNPNLLCIEVDDATYSTTNWLNKDATASYSTDCSTFSSTTTLAGEKINITTYPNPTTNNININLGKNYQTAMVELRNMMGQTVSSKEYNAVNQIDMNIEGAAGIYFVNVRTELGEVVVKLVKE